MAKVIKLKDRSGALVLPLTRSQLVQVSTIPGLNLLNEKSWNKASVQDALEALMSYASSISVDNAQALADITTIKAALEGVLDTQKAVVNYVDSQDSAYLALAYAQSSADAQAAQDASYSYAGKVAADALAEVDVTVAATSGSVITGFEIEDGKLKANSVTEVALTSSNVTRIATTGLDATTVEGALVELAGDIDTAYTNAEAYTDEKVNAFKSTLNDTITAESGKVFTSITQTDGVLSYTDAALTASDITRAATTGAHGVAATTVEGAIQELAAAVDAGGTGSVVSVTEVTTGLGAGVLKAYQIWQGDTSDSANLKGTINIPKDFLVKSASIEVVSTDDDPYTGAVVGDKYIDFVINVADASETAQHVYLPVNDLVDVYTATNQTAEVTVAIDSANNITATIGTVAASKISYNGSTVDAELTTINTTLTAHQSDLTSYNTRIEALEDAAEALSYSVVAGTNESYITVTPSTSGSATTFTITTSDIASATNLSALQTSYDNLVTELTNSGVFYEQVGTSTVDDVTLDTF